LALALHPLPATLFLFDRRRLPRLGLCRLPESRCALENWSGVGGNSGSDNRNRGDRTSGCYRWPGCWHCSHHGQITI